MDKVKGHITKIVFFNKDYYICKFLTVNKEIISITGSFDVEPSKNFLYTFGGTYNKHHKYGLSFKIQQLIKREINMTSDNNINFLSSSLFTGIGKKTARYIVNHLGENSAHILIQDPMKIYEIGFLTQKQKDVIYNGLSQHKNANEIYKFLFDNNIDIKIFNKIKKKYIEFTEKEVLELIKNDIYVFLDNNYLNFKEIDSIYLKLHEDKVLDEKRISHISCYLINKYCFQNNHTNINLNILYDLIVTYLNKTKDKILDNQDIKTKIKRAWLYAKNHKMLIFIKPNVSIYQTYMQEETIAKQLFYNNKKTNKEVKPSYSSSNTDINYDNKQKQALYYALNNRISIISGGPGTGKTSIIQLIIDNFKISYPKYKIKLLAPTGRAAKRISQKTTMIAHTIHSYLKWNGDDKVMYDHQNPVEEDIIIVDEMSMVNNQTFYFLMNACKNVKHFIFIGDINQLSAIGPGNILDDLINLNDIPTTFLTKIYRQKKGNDIIKLAKEVLLKKISIQDYNISNEVEFIVNSNVKEELFNIYNYLKTKKIDLINNVQFISPLYKSQNGVNKINEWFQDENSSNLKITIYNKIFYQYDKVMQIINRPEMNIYNGDVGIIEEINNQDDVLNVQFDNEVIEYDYNNIGDIVLSYGSTIHKVQGSEYDYVILIIDNANFDMINNQIIYTAITRAKNKIYIISKENTFINAINKDRPIINTNIITLYKKLKKQQ